MWKVLVTLLSLLAVALTFGILYAFTLEVSLLAIAASAAGALGGYLGKVNGSGN